MTKRILIISIILAIAIPCIVNADSKCSLCGKSITGQYVRFDDGTVYCLSCMDNNEKCSICGKPSVSLAKIDGKNICRNCLVKLDKCDNCGKPIAGRSTYFPGIDLRLCEKCLKTMPRCDMCGRPDNNLIKAGNKRICQSCYNQAAFCFICGEPIEGRYSWFDGDSTKKYCQNCISRYPECADCGAPTGKNSIRLDDNRILCRACYKEAYFSPQKVSSIKHKVLTYIESALGMKIKHKVKYTLQGQDFIKKKSEGISGDINGLFYRLNDNFEIYILYGLRKKDLYQVIPHEIAHAWAAENCPRNMSLEDAEGFAQWVAYHALGNFGYSDFRETLLEGNTMYAAGLRKMLKIEKQKGIQGVFSYITKN